MKKTQSAFVAMLSVLPFLANAQWSTNGNDAYFNLSGKLGIGISNPQAKLQVYGTRTSTINSASAITQIGGADIFTSFGALNGAPNYGAWMQVLRYTDDAVFPLFLNPIGGNVGIGTTTANERLTVNGAVAAFGQVQTPMANTTYIDYCPGCSASRLLATGANNSTFGIIKFVNSTADASGYRESLTILGNGNVGIGTSSPDQKFVVNGTIHSSEVKVDTSIPVPDYVFDADYKLASLTEVKDYIAKNHHLPEIPSAAQIEKDGLKLGEMNTLLLKKVEELTLHLIEKDKQVNDQQKRVDQLQQQIQALNKEIHKN